MIGRTLSHYKVIDKIGEGGMGEVYKARDEHLSRDVAIKVVPSGTLADEHARKRFRKEALALSKLNHPTIATVFDFDTQEGTDFIVMELVEGVSLAEKVQTGPLLEKEISDLGSQIADALQEAHENGIIHRDLKPGNIAVTPKSRVKVLDFGLARMLKPVSDEATTEALTQEHAVAGTLPYMSPEELRGEKADNRSDLFSFGVVLYEMATGRRPFEHTISTALVDAIIHKAPVPPSTHNRKIPPGLESIIIKALDKDPDHRYQSARELRVDLERLGIPVSAPVPVRERSSATRWLAAAACVVGAIAILFVLNVGSLWDRLVREPGPRINSIAVLPLENLSGDPEQEYFADGMTESLIADLAKIRSLRVISRQSVMRFKGTDIPLLEIAETLKVEAVVAGSVMRSGDRVRITTQVVQASPEQHLWADSYERELRDILLLQSEVAREIAQEIEISITPEDDRRLTGARQVNPEAHEAYLKGLFHWNRFTAEGFRKATEYFGDATKADPSFALAYVGLSRSYSMRGAWFGDMAPKDAFPLGRKAAERALGLDDTLGLAHTELAMNKYLFDWDWMAAEREFRRGIELAPETTQVHGSYGFFLRGMARFDEAIERLNKALSSDPLSPINLVELALSYCATNRLDLALDKCGEALELGFPRAHDCLGRVYLTQGRFEEATKAFLKIAAAPDATMRMLGLAYVKAGKKKEALSIIGKLEQSPQAKYYSMASIAAALGEKDRAMEWLEKAIKAKEPDLALLPQHRAFGEFASLSDDPRFQDLLRRMNFPE